MHFLKTLITQILLHTTLVTSTQKSVFFQHHYKIKNRLHYNYLTQTQLSSLFPNYYSPNFNCIGDTTEQYFGLNSIMQNQPGKKLDTFIMTTNNKDSKKKSLMKIPYPSPDADTKSPINTKTNNKTTKT